MKDMSQFDGLPIKRHCPELLVGECDYCHTAVARLYAVGDDELCADCRADVRYCERKGKEMR
jgi:hypothetical protein